MEKDGVLRLFILGLYVCFAALLIVQCDAIKITHRHTLRKHMRNFNTKPSRKSHFFKKFDTYAPIDTSNASPDVSSPFSMPPFDSLPPISLPDNTPPYCVYPPFTPQPPSTIPSPSGFSSPPPPASYEPTLPDPTPNPPTQPVLSPPYYEPSPPNNTPSPRFLPPVVYPPPSVPLPPQQAPSTAMWCVAKAAVPEPIIEEAMNYACGSGGDCGQIQPDGPCFEPNSVLAHASYAFNSYWQRTKVGGGTCDFGGTALLVTVDPSYDGCHFVYF